MNLKLCKWNDERHGELMGKINHKNKCHLPHNFDPSFAMAKRSKSKSLTSWRLPWSRMLSSH